MTADPLTRIPAADDLLTITSSITTDEAVMPTPWPSARSIISPARRVPGACMKTAHGPTPLHAPSPVMTARRGSLPVSLSPGESRRIGKASFVVAGE
jgi:hypothetical protein